MRALLLTTLLITACLSEDEISVSQSGDVIRKDLINVNSHAYIEQGECLIDIKSSLDLNSNTSLPPLANSQCLPSSKLSWLFRAKKITQTTRKNLQLAVLFDTSYSLNTTDPGGKRYTALKDSYLIPLFREIKAAGVAATIKVFPFKYCNVGSHELRIESTTEENFFEEKVNSLIASLKGYNVNGSTNYLQSFALAAGFLNKAGDSDVKQMLIFSDGLPLTYNDGTTSTITCASHKQIIKDIQLPANESFAEYVSDLSGCVSGAHYPSIDSCKAPLGNKYDKNGNMERKGAMGMSGNKLAFNDPINHILGMIQHSRVMDHEKHKFEVYAMLLQVPCNEMSVGEKGEFEAEKRICEAVSHLAKPFVASLTNAHVIVPNASELAKGIKDILKVQTSFTYRRYGKAYINTTSKDSNVTEVDSSTKWYEGNLIKVGRDKKSDTVYEYKDNAQNTLTVNHGLYGRGGSFEIGYDFEFPEANSKGVTDCRSADNSKIGNLEVNKYRGNGYTAWCLLSPRCDRDDQCCDPSNIYREITTDEGVQRCANKGQDWQWVGFKDKKRECACVCDYNGRGEAACQGKGQSWNDATCSCESAPVTTSPECVPSTTVCCKGGKGQAQPQCSAKAGEILDVANCRCVQETSQPPPTSSTQRECDRSRECCDGDTVITSQSCSARQTWLGFPNCQCVRKTTTNPPIVVTPTNPTQTNTGTMGGNEGNQGNMGGKEPENSEKNGKVLGEKGDPVPPPPLPNQGIVWGEYESF